MYVSPEKPAIIAFARFIDGFNLMRLFGFLS